MRLSDRMLAAAGIGGIVTIPASIFYMAAFWDSQTSAPLLIAAAATFAALTGILYLVLSDNIVQRLSGRRDH